jgi:signal transduction histidine kinase
MNESEVQYYLTNICHELQSPLQGIIGNLEQLKKLLSSARTKMDAAVYSELNGYIDGIDVSVTHQTAITRRFLTAAKLNASKLDLNLSTVTLHKAISDVIKIFRPNLRPKQHIVVNFPREDIYFEADETQLKQIAIVLISNALKFTAEGIITIGLQYKLEESKSEYEIEFSVADTGIGMSEEEQNHVFQRFSQANSGIVGKFGGFGLGLTICKQLVDLMGGKITVESSRGKGSKFSIILHVVKRDPPQEGDQHVNDTAIVVARPPDLPSNFLDMIASGGAMGKHMLGIDWSKTELGPITSWPRSLVLTVNICLKNEYPMSIWWGPNLILLYNDSYRPYLGDKHPAMGKRGLDIWGELKMDLIGMLRGALAGEKSKFQEDLLLLMERNGFQEEVYFTFSLSPIFDEDMQVVGVLDVTLETTKKVLNTRRMNLLREVSSVNKAGTITDVCKSMAKALTTCPADLPFTLLYLFNGENKLVLESCTGLEPGTLASPVEVDILTSTCLWPFADVMKSMQHIKVPDIVPKFGPLPGGIWPESPNYAVVLPLISNSQQTPIGVFIAGISPRRLYDADYQAFFDMVVSHISKALDTVHAYEEQKKRAEELAKIDHAKTVFFTNISHEFRTPLSLMLGPLADSLADKQYPLNESQRERQIMIQRNAFRLLKLVNTILDFSRIEAGRAQISFVPTDLTKLTRELCQLFSSLMEQSSLEYIMDLDELAEPVFVDVEMWEKIVMNLISNAFKFTLKGRITVSLKQIDDQVRLAVRDTGVGIPEHEMPNMFRRFHRIENTQGRSFEGSGIGLALIQELTKLHGGGISVESKFGKGTSFSVTIPLGSSHLPRDKIKESIADVAVSISTRSIVDEASQWGNGNVTNELTSSSDEEDSFEALETQSTNKYRVLLADDNHDMRSYIKQILSKLWHVDTATDGEMAYKIACANPPDLLLSDVMMPRLDGFGLIKKIRSNALTKSIPVILLSARAGEEAKVEGLGHGADDYLVKTSFSEKELIARVKNHLELGRLRKHLEAEVKEKTRELRQLNTALYEFIDMICHEIRNPLHGITGSWELLSERLFSIEKAWQAATKTQDPIKTFRESVTNDLVDMKDYLNNLEECTVHQTRVMDEVVLLTKLYSNKFELSPTIINPAVLATNIAQEYAEKLEQRSITLELQTVFGLRFGLDARCLSHIIHSLLTCIIDKVPSGSHIVISQSTAVISDQFSELVTRITCNNYVMSQETFDEYASLHQHSFANRSMGSHYSNTGFTIAISNLLSKVMGGSAIQVLDDPEQSRHGFLFSVTCTTAPEEVASSQLPKKAREPTKQVLVAEDNYINQVLCRCLLKKQGYMCEIAANGQEAVDKFKPEHYDFILMDIAMPELNGVEVTRRIRDIERAQNVGNGTFIIGLSAYAQPEKIVEAIEAGMNDFISKPATFDKIGNIIAQWVNADSNKKKNKEDVVAQNTINTGHEMKRKKPVLIVEDNVINQTLLSSLLKKQGHDVVLAGTGPEVLEKFVPEAFSMIFMDLTLPIMNGVEVTKKIRQIEASSSAAPIVIVGLSAHTDEQLIEMAKQAGLG